jgi:catechol 2,3-dioxygenase-like lactoylglutathione lyase family enzyme
MSPPRARRVAEDVRGRPGAGVVEPGAAILSDVRRENSMFRTYGLSHINIPISNLERSVGFYTGLFGMQVIRRFDDCAMLRTPGTHEVMTLSVEPEEAKKMAKLAGFHFGFRLTELIDMNAVLEEAVRLGGTQPTQGGTREKGRVWAGITDPDGHEVEVFWEDD